MKARQFVKTSIAKELSAIKEVMNNVCMDMLIKAAHAAEQENKPEIFWDAFYMLFIEASKKRQEYIKAQFNKAKYEADINVHNNK